MNDGPRDEQDAPTDVGAWLRGLPRRRKPDASRLFGTARSAAAADATGTDATGTDDGSDRTDTDTDADTRGAG